MRRVVSKASPILYHLTVVFTLITTFTSNFAISRELDDLAVQGAGSMAALRHQSAWHFLKVSGSEGLVYSITHTAEPLESDPDFAGMVVRCSSKLGLQVGFVLIVPLAPRAKPQVELSVSKDQSRQFGATVLAPGTIVLITTDAEPLVQMLARSPGKISVVIEGDQAFRGVVPLDDFGAAVASLRGHCL